MVKRMRRRQEEDQRVLSTWMLFYHRYKGPLALIASVLLVLSGVLGWTVTLDGVKTTGGELRQQNVKITTIDTRLDSTRTDQAQLREEVEELRRDILPLLEAQSRTLCYQFRTSANLAGVPCASLGRRQPVLTPSPLPFGRP